MVEGRPVMSMADVHEWAAKFGLCEPGEKMPFVQELPSYDDLNFRLRSPAGEEFVLKANNGMVPCGQLSRLLAQNRFMERLREGGVPVQKAVAARGGEEVLSMASPGAPEANQLAHVRVLTYIPGNIVGNEVPKSDRFLQVVGEACGTVTRALVGFRDDGCNWDWDWNMKNGAPACEARVHWVKDPERQALARQLIASYAAACTAEALEGLPHSVIHSDLNDTNLLFDGEGDDVRVAGVLDFGDCIYACTVFEVGIVAGYYAMGQPDPMNVFSEVLRGYLRTAPASLSDKELEIFFHAAYGRVMMSVVFAAAQSAAEPDNEYLSHTSEPGWATLVKLKDVTPEMAFKRFREVRAACTDGS